MDMDFATSFITYLFAVMIDDVSYNVFPSGISC